LTKRKYDPIISKLDAGTRYMKKLSKQLTTKQESFLEHLLETGGNSKKAAELAGYTTHWAVVKSLKNEIIDLASNILAQKLVTVMESNEPIPQASMRVQAAQTILDRVGLGKRDTLDVKHEVTGGVFILPAKEEIIIDVGTAS
jgi:phage terminase small subunit